MADIRKERALREIEEKAENLAMLWFEKNYVNIYRNPLSSEKVPKNAAKLYKDIAETRKRLVQMQKEEDAKERLKRRPQHKELHRPTLEFPEELLQRGPMYPVPKEQWKLIFNGISHNDEGRWAYLKERNKLSPDMKYYDPLTYAMEYGWKVEERGWRPIKEFVRSHCVIQSFYRRSGTLEVDDLQKRLPFTASQKFELFKLE